MKVVKKESNLIQVIYYYIIILLAIDGGLGHYTVNNVAQLYKDLPE